MDYLSMFKKLWTKKKWIIAIVILIGIIGGVVLAKTRNNAGDLIVAGNVVKQDLEYTVLATGQVTSSVDVSLAFKGSGIVKQVGVKVGDVVTAGQVLARLDQSDVSASVTTARASVAQAQANLEKILDGASTEEVVVSQRAVDTAQVALDNALQNVVTVKKQQAVIVANAYTALLNSGFSAAPGNGNLSSGTVTVSGSYNSNEQGQYKITLYQSGTGLRFLASGLENTEGDVKTTPVPFGKRGLFIQFSNSTFYPNVDTWMVVIPNTQASLYTTNLNAYQAALETQSSAVSSAEAGVRNAQTALDQAKANLLLKKQQARPADISAARAQILSAQGQLQAAEANFQNTQITAPTGGTVTTVKLKVGETATPSQEVIVIQDVNNLYVEANISEANIASITLGQEVAYTFDALGPDKKFTGKLEAIDPASTVVSGVVNYKVTASVPKVPDVKPGMTANMTVVIAKKQGVLTVPTRAVLTSNGNKTVRVITDAKKGTYEEVPVSVGLEGDGGLVEITSGLTEGQSVVTLLKKK